MAASPASMPLDGAASPDSDRLGDSVAYDCISGSLRRIAEDDEVSACNYVVLNCEDRAEEWHFDEAAHAACVEGVKDKCRALKHREARARELKSQSEREANDHAQEVLERVEGEERERAAELSKMREEVMETQDATEELLEYYREQETLIEREIEAERRRRLDVEAELRNERRQAEAARRRIEEIESNAEASLRAHDQRMRDLRAEASREINDVRHTTQEQVAQIEQKFREERSRLQQEIDEAVQEAQGGVVAEVRQRDELLSNAQADVRGVDEQVRDGLRKTHLQVLAMQDTLHQQVSEIQAQDFALEALLQEHADAAITALSCAMEEKEQAAMVEKEHKRRCATAVKALGATFPRSTQYQLHPDKKGKSALMLSARSVVPVAHV